MYIICKSNLITCVNQSKCAVMKCFILAEFHNMNKNIHVQGSTFQSVQSLTLSHDEGIDGRKGIILKSGRNQVSRKPAFVWICIWSNLCLGQRPLQVKLLQHRLVEGKRSSPCWPELMCCKSCKGHRPCKAFSNTDKSARWHFATLD